MNSYGTIVNRCFMCAALAVSLLIGMSAIAPAAEHADESIVFGYMERIFKHRHQNDVMAAMKVWAEAVGADTGLPIDSRMSVFARPEDMVRALRDGRIGAITLGLDDYLLIPPDCLSGPYLTEVRNGATHVRYVLVAAKSNGIADVGDLAGKRVAVHDDAYSAIGRTWLEASLHADGRGSLQDTAARVDLQPKASSAVLDVFFGRADACLVHEHLLESMADLNPQIAQRLTVVASSDPILANLVAFNINMPAAIRQQLSEVIATLHGTPAGDQLTLMFQIDGLHVVTEEELKRSGELLSSWHATSAMQSERASR